MKLKGTIPKCDIFKMFKGTICCINTQYKQLKQHFWSCFIKIVQRLHWLFSETLHFELDIIHNFSVRFATISSDKNQISSN